MVGGGRRNLLRSPVRRSYKTPTLERKEWTRYLVDSRRLTKMVWFLSTGLLFAGCERDEMPMPPPAEYETVAEKDFHWAMERLQHALEMIHPPSGSGLKVKREMKYELFPPSGKKKNYTGQVTIVTKTFFNHQNSPSAEEDKKAKQKADNNKRQDPFSIPGEDPLDVIDNLPDIELPQPVTVNPQIPLRETKDEAVFHLKYADNTWKLLDEPEGEVEKLWFDYAFQRDSAEE